MLKPVDMARVLGTIDIVAEDLLQAVGKPAQSVRGGHEGADLDAGLRWHAARLTDFASMLRAEPPSPST